MRIPHLRAALSALTLAAAAMASQGQPSMLAQVEAGIRELKLGQLHRIDADAGVLP